LLGNADSVTVRVFDSAGDAVARLDGSPSPGLQKVDWDFGEAANGVYFFTVEARGGARKDRRRGKLVILR
jgi:hypothetical protein